MCQFSHLHVHTQFSLLDGAASIDSLYKKAQQQNMPALAITDHGNMFGAFEFVSQAWKNTKVVGTNADGKPIKQPVVKPIVGCEFYVVENRWIKQFTKGEKDQRFHQVLLAKNATGYKNLVKLTSLGYIEGMYSKYPRIDKALIEQYKEGLIATTCCIGAYVPQTILHKSVEDAEAELKWWYDLFGNDYYIELQRHNLPEQEKINQVLMQFAKKYDIPVIATNDSHYTDIEDYNAHDILLCINTGEKQSTPGFDDLVNDDLQVKNKRFKFPNNQFYFKSTDEMKTLFSDIPEAIDNTNAIVDKVDVLQLERDILLPAFPVPESFKIHADDTLNQWEYLKHLTYEGAAKRYGEIEQSTQERIDFELFTIKTMGFAGYFLIVSDFIAAGKQMGVFVGPGRGSAAGSVVAYCIGITNIDPIKYDLLFERFLNPDRKSMPDIDTDFDDEGRQKVIDYVVDKYGKQQVAQIITYGTMAAKSSIKDVARVMDLPLADSNALAKLVPDKPGTELKHVLHAKLSNDGYLVMKKGKEELFALDADAIDRIKQLRDIYTQEENDLRGKVLREAERLEGSVRNTGIHAAGIIIAPKNLTELIPVATSKDSDLWVTQIEGSIIESAGVIKMDFLGLKTLSILKTALELIALNHNIQVDLEQIPLTDEATYQLYQRGETNGTFQFESVGMQKYLRELKPDKFDDLIAMNALYRPGPLSYIPNYIARKHGREPILYDIEDAKEYLQDTYGITVYQEQVMLLSQKLAGFTKGDADVLRKAMGKKQKEVLDKMKEKFISGAVAKGYDNEKLEKIWSDWEAFAQYAFNKSHSTCYAYVAYQTAYLKAHYPSEYMSAVLNHAGSIEKITFFMEECKRMGIKVMGPDINESIKGFSPNKNGDIRFGLGFLKGVGENAIESIIKERDANGAYKNIFDFITRNTNKSVNKKSLECLIKGGAFDGFSELHRAQYFQTQDGEKLNGLERIILYGQAMQELSSGTSNTLFGDLPMAMDIPTPKIAASEPWSLTEKLEYEKEVTGMFLSGHPLDDFKFEMEHYGFMHMVRFNEISAEIIEKKKYVGKQIRLAGLIIDVQHRVTKTGKNYGIIKLEDYTEQVEFTLWSEDYIKFQNYLDKGIKVALNGTFKQRYDKEEYDFKITQMQLLETVKDVMTKQVDLMINPALLNEKMVQFISEYVQTHPGKSGLRICFKPHKEYLSMAISDSGRRIKIADSFTEFLANNPDIEVKVTLN